MSDPRPPHPAHKLVKELRDRKLSYQKAADLTSLTAQHLHMLAHGCRTFTPMVAEKLANAGFSTAMDWLLTQAKWSAWKEKNKGASDGQD